MTEAELANDGHGTEAKAEGRGTEVHWTKPHIASTHRQQIVPSTMTHVPARMGRVTRSPRSRIARPVEINGIEVLIAADTGATNCPRCP